MAKSVVSKRKTQDIEVHPYDVKIDSVYNLIGKELPRENITLIEKYDKHMVRNSLER